MTKERFLELVRESYESLGELNIAHLPDENVDVTILDEPLVGFASPDDPYFDKYHDPAAIGPDWKMPREWMPEAETVAAFFFPFTGEIRRRHREAAGLTDEAWNNSYGKGMPMINNEYMDILCSKLEAEGVRTFMPTRSPDFTRTPMPVMSGGEEDIHFSTAWSNRHICYVAGLGTFGIHRHIITEKGSCGTLASVLIDVRLEPTPREYTGIYDYCTRCGACTGRCPAHAITVEHLRNLKKCSGHSGNIRATLGGGFCGKCLVGTPCEDRIPGRA